MAEKEKMLKHMLYDANNDKDLLNERVQTEEKFCIVAPF